MPRRFVILAMVVAATTSAASGRSHPAELPGFATGDCRLGSKTAPGSGAVRVVDKTDAGAFQTIQAGVDAASEGDTILVKPGVYREHVIVTTPGLRIRGTDRNAVVVDGGNELPYGIHVKADRVVVENMTGHNYTNTAFYWEYLTGYWGRYLTGYDNGAYGIYAYDARCGQFDNSYASGNADSGFYIGECYPCDAVIERIEATGNALGYSGTNAGGNLTLRDSKWYGNGMGIVPNSLNGELNPPQRGATIENNLVENNNDATAPGAGLAGMYFGSGIVIAGGQDNQITGNTVLGHIAAGIALAPLPDPTTDAPTTPLFVPAGNTVWGNTVRGAEGSFDLAQGLLSGPGNCWANNDYQTSAPPGLETIWACNSTLTPPGGDPRIEVFLLQGAAGQNGRTPSPWQTWPAPGPQQNMPDDDGDGNYADDGAVDTWIPALGLTG